MLSRARKLWENDEGAVAPLVALSLVGLIAVGGVGFDYAHLVALHTEVQNAGTVGEPSTASLGVELKGL